MTCHSCGKETKGIKLNGKLFCTFCGEVVKDPTRILEEAYTATPEPKPEKTTAQANDDMSHKLKVVAPDNTVQEPAKINGLTIKKHERNRADQQTFKLIEREPDPVNEPELSSPHDDLIEGKSTTDKTEKTMVNKIKEPSQAHYTLMDKRDRDELKQKSQKHQDVFNLFLKQTSKAISDKNTPRTKKKKKRTRHRHKSIWIFATVITVGAAVSGLAYYVNAYATNPAHISSRIESKTAFVYQKPQDIPAGYELSYLSKSEPDSIEYIYLFNGNKNRYFKIRIEPTETKPSDLQTKVISTLGVSYSSSRVDGTEFWQTSDHQIIAQNDGVLYTYGHSGEFPDDLFMDVAQGMLR